MRRASRPRFHGWMNKGGTLENGKKKIDYRQLLKKYMRLVIDREGIDLLSFGGRFSPDEIQELRTISKEIYR